MVEKSTKIDLKSAKLDSLTNIPDFCKPFWHRFIDFFNERENLKIDDPYNTLACFGFRKPSVFPSIFHTFSMFFQARCQNTFFNPPGDTLFSRIRIFTNFGASTGPTISHSGDILRPKGSRKVRVVRTGRVPGPTCLSFAPEVWLRWRLHRFRMLFSRIFNHF